MPEDLCRLVYHSANRIMGADADIDRSLRDILAVARRNNQRLNVTGALMFTANGFVQVLEGPRAAVDQLFQAIKKDARHENVSVLMFAPVAERAFPHWSMAFVGGPELQGRFAAFARESGYDPSRMSADATLDFLQKVLRAQERAQDRAQDRDADARRAG